MTRAVITLLFLLIGLIVLAPATATAQVYTWLAAGSLHNFYVDIGCEREEAIELKQQSGLKWPAIYLNQDIQAAKALWIGTTNYQEGATLYPHKVVHIGPRVDGKNEFTAVTFEKIARFEPTKVEVDGLLRTGVGGQKDALNRIDPTMVGDRMIYNVANTAIGITMTRKLIQFSQTYHDNYIVHDYVFKNNAGKRLTGVYFYYQYRLAPCAHTRYYIGNGSGWGMNTMLDTRGDGIKADADDYEVAGNPATPHMRIQYVWHGYFPTKDVTYDNVGGPIWGPPKPASQYGDPSDTTGFIGAPQFAGIVTLHADRSATDKTDDPGQPSTTSWEGSDEPLTSQNDQFNSAKMSLEYEWMSKGHKSPRHADAVEPAGNFRSPTGNPALGTPGGFSNANGYGPYDLNPGDSIHIVMAEGVAGLGYEACLSVGRKYKQGTISAAVKNDSVLTGKDSLFQTFRRAIANFRSNWGLAQAPPPPKSFTVTSLGDKVQLTWDAASDPLVAGYRVYRSVGRYDAPATLLATLGPQARSYDDLAAIRAVAGYYYIEAVGYPGDNTGQGGTPAGVALTSNRMYTQSYDAAYLKRQAGNAKGPDNMDSIRIVPNPFSLSRTPSLWYAEEEDKIAFLDVPGYCKIRVYTELGELIKEFDHNDGAGDHFWYSVTSSRQVVVSGIYIVVFDNVRTGQRVIKKLAVIR